MKTTKKVGPGRPRVFDLDEVLMAAVQVFWVKGYEGSSIKDLTDAMGINAPSLYSTFGDKRGLYLQAIDRYANIDGCAPVIAFETEPDITKAVRGFLESVILYATSHESGARGCFLASSVSTSAGEIKGVRERLAKAIEDTDVRLAKRFEEEKKKGTLPQDFPSRERASLMFDLRQGYVLRGRAGCSADILTLGLEHRITMILAQPILLP